MSSSSQTDPYEYMTSVVISQNCGRPRVVRKVTVHPDAKIPSRQERRSKLS